MPLWITVDCELGNHPKMAALPNDSARYGWILTLTEAKKQRTPGTFASANHFRHVMGRHGRFLNDYIKAKLIDKADDDTLLVHDWRRHQWAVSKAQQRETSGGQDEDIEGTLGGLQEDASRAVSVSVSLPVLEGDTEGGPGETADAAVSLHRRTGTFPSPKILSWLNEIATAHGELALVHVIDTTPLESRNVRDYIVAIRDRLRSDEHSASRAEKADEERRNAEKRRPVIVRRTPDDITDEEAQRQAREFLGKPA
jgi:hypothetical protein